MTHAFKLLEDFIDSFWYNAVLALIGEKVVSHSETTQSILVTEIVIPVGSEHSVCLARTCLAIGEYGRIETFQYIVYTLYHC